MFTTIDEAIAEAHDTACTVYRLGKRVVAVGVPGVTCILQGREGEYRWSPMRAVEAPVLVAAAPLDDLPY